MAIRHRVHYRSTVVSLGFRSFKQLRTVVVAFGLLIALSPALPADAQETPGLSETRERLTELVTMLSNAETDLAALEHEVLIAEVTNTRLEQEISNLRAQAGEAAISEFMDSTPDVGLFAVEDPMSSLRVETLTNVASGNNADSIEIYRVLFEDLAVSRLALDETTSRQDETLAFLRETRAEIGVELERLEALEVERLAEVRRKEEARRKAEAERKAEEARKAQQAADAAGSSGGAVPDNGSADADADTETTPSVPDPSPGPASTGTALAYCPVAGAVSFIDSWGYARSGGRRHKGVDMMASIGTPVAAPVSGTVKHRSNRLGGRSFHLQGDDGNYYYGTHMSDYGASGYVQAGEIIGYVGDDGNARGIPHLHFEVHPGGGGAVNPYPHVNAVC